MTDETTPGPDDWLTQAQLAELLAISQQTASERAKEGRLVRFEHGIDGAGRRRYSRHLVQREFQNCRNAAEQRQDEVLRIWGDPPREIRVHPRSGPSQGSTE